VSISTTFYERLFCTKVLGVDFLKLQLGFVIFWQKNIGTQAACKMLMKLTKGVNFTNILLAVFFTALICLLFGFVIFCQKEICPKQLLLKCW